MSDSLKVPSLIDGGNEESIRELFCMLAVGRDENGNETETHCRGIACHECMFDSSNEKEFIAWFAMERINGNFNLI